MTPARVAAVLSAAAFCAASVEDALAQARASADVICRPSRARLQYDCMIKLTDARTKAPLAGATLTVRADMPSMPMAHNIRPAKAAPGSEPGAYNLRLELDMHGHWSLRIDVAGPVRDRVVVPLVFDDEGAHPPAPSRPTPHRP
jgi:YtkA-like protein